ncbi:MAG TPA: tetratricopeptide repeat protein [Steroidobacteraceae bacterium]|nr:tetratricopeptide repeat protein [Steroidobacteraceae bacterium]
MPRLALIALLGGLAAAPVAAQAPARNETCQSGTPPAAAIGAARTALERKPDSLDARLQLADALMEDGCYGDAIAILQAGQADHPHSVELQSRLREAQSSLNEQHYFEGLGEAAESAKLQRNVLRCSRMSDLHACDEALQVRPGDPAILQAKGAALLQANRPADAATVLRRAVALSPADDSLKSRLASAESQRQALAGKCQTGTGQGALDACQAALLHGSDDEFAIRERQAILLQSTGKPAEALDAYIAADNLRQDDRSVALAIVALTQSTDRQDAVALAARGSALLTLERGRESLEALRQAQSLAPELPGLKQQLARAQALAKRESAVPRLAGAAPARPVPSRAKEPSAPPALARATPPAPTYSNEADLGRSN